MKKNISKTINIAMCTICTLGTALAMIIATVPVSYCY